MKIGYIGLGKLGLPCAEVLAENEYLVKGFDIAPIQSNKIQIVNTIKECVNDVNIVFVAVPTPHHKDYDGSIPVSHLEPKDFSYEIVKDVVAEANKHMNNDQLLVLISTVLPGTVRNSIIPLITNTRFIYNPYLIAMGSVAWDMVNPEMVMIGTEDGSETGDANKLIELYKTVMKNDPRYVVGTWDECECIKIFYNTFISAKLSLVNMIQDVAEKQGNINVDIVTSALAKSTYRIMGPQYMTAGMGDGGACHPRDNIALRFLAKNLNLNYDIFDTIISSREEQAKNLAKFIVEQAKDNNLPIVIHGKSYKPGVSYCDGSYSLLIGYYCKELGVEPQYVDPKTNDSYNSASPAVFLLAHNTDVTYKYTDNNVFFDNMYCHIPDNSIVIDPWRSYINKKCKVIHYGNTRNL